MRRLLLLALTLVPALALGSPRITGGLPGVTSDGSNGLSVAGSAAVGGTFTVGTGAATTINVTPLTVAQLLAVASPTAGDFTPVSDGTDASDCATGGGTTWHWCRYSGTGWVASSSSYTLPDSTSSVTGGIRVTNDLAGSATAPTVVATHLSSALPQAQGGTGAAALTCSAGQHITSNGTAYSCSADSGGPSLPLSGANGGLGQAQPTCSGGQHLTCNGTTCSCSADATASDATTGAKGVVQLANDLGGTAALPTVVGLHLPSATANYVLAAPNGSSGSPSMRALVAADIPTLNQSTTGNAATATALAANGANCSAGQAPLGVDASGAAEGCWTPASPVASGNGNYVYASPNGSSGTPSMRALVAADMPLAPVTSANGGTITANFGYYLATGTTTFTLPATAAGKQFCFRQANAGTNAITVTPPTSSYVEASDGSAYCTVSHAIKSGGANGDQLCVVAIDSTHWASMSAKGTWTCQ